MRVLDLFSGIGGFSLGLERAGMETVAFCEIEPYCQRVLRKHWPDVPIFEDIRTLKGEDVGPVELICGGYPCQPFSHAGQRRGEEDDRHLWPEYLRLIRDIRPRWVIGENVAGHISMGLDTVLSDLEAEGYTWEAFVIPACAVDARHRRDRVWIIGHADNESKPVMPVHDEMEIMQGAMANTGHASGRENTQQCDVSREVGICGERDEADDKLGTDGENVANTDLQRLKKQRERESTRKKHAGVERGCRWEAEPAVGRVADGIPRRVDRLRALGNAVVPQIPEIIGRAILEYEAGFSSDVLSDPQAE